jgi:hypothetical protein
MREETQEREREKARARIMNKPKKGNERIRINENAGRLWMLLTFTDSCNFNIKLFTNFTFFIVKTSLQLTYLLS